MLTRNWTERATPTRGKIVLPSILILIALLWSATAIVTVAIARHAIPAASAWLIHSALLSRNPSLALFLSWQSFLIASY